MSWRAAKGGALRSASLIRAPITLRAVSSALCGPLATAEGAPPPPRVGYIRIGAFSALTPPGVEAALRSLSDEGATAMVLDLRANGGGSFPAGVAVAKQLIPKARTQHS